MNKANISFLQALFYLWANDAWRITNIIPVTLGGLAVLCVLYLYLLKSCRLTIFENGMLCVTAWPFKKSTLWSKISKVKICKLGCFFGPKAFLDLYDSNGKQINTMFFKAPNYSELLDTLETCAGENHIITKTVREHS